MTRLPRGRENRLDRRLGAVIKAWWPERATDLILVSLLEREILVCHSDAGPVASDAARRIAEEVVRDPGLAFADRHGHRHVRSARAREKFREKTEKSPHWEAFRQRAREDSNL
jgi:hypothetical protein